MEILRVFCRNHIYTSGPYLGHRVELKREFIAPNWDKLKAKSKGGKEQSCGEGMFDP